MTPVGTTFVVVVVAEYNRFFAWEYDMACDYIKVLNLAKEGEWDEAHQLVQPYSDEWSCLIHGYLHRVEGDSANARYWYGRANTEMPQNSLEDELTRLYSLVDKEIRS